MLVYLVQHAEAKREEEDPARDLTAKGRQDITRVAQYAGDLRLTVSRIYHSGKTRASSTAEILAASLKPSQGVALAAAGLKPLDDPVIWADRLKGMTEDLALVGHLPHLARLAALLTCGDQEKNVINFKMGGMVCLRRLEAGPWTVEWMLIPELIR
jgi:phosphohistidine phosphatase